MAAACAADIKSVGIAKNTVALAHVKECDLGRPARPIGPQAAFDTVDAFGIEVGDQLPVLQTIQLRYLRRPEPTPDTRVQLCVVAETKAQRNVRRQVCEIVFSIRGPRVKATAKSAGRAVIARVAAYQPYNFVLYRKLVQRKICA